MEWDKLMKEVRNVGEIMLRIVVFDSGWGGELVANFLMEELKMVEVVRVIDCPHAPYCGRTREEICWLVEQGLADYIGQMDVIVLGGYAVSLALEYLRERYPEQKFVGMGINYDAILRTRSYPENVVLMMDQLTSESELRQELRQRLQYSTLVIPDCTGWEELINEGLMMPEILRRDLGYDFALAEPVKRKQVWGDRAPGSLGSEILGMNEPSEDIVVTERADKEALRAAIAKFAQAAEEAAADECALVRQFAEEVPSAGDDSGKIHPDTVLLLNTHFWEIKLDLEAIFGWKVRVLDFREKLLHDVCAALKLRGVHGKRAK